MRLILPSGRIPRRALLATLVLAAAASMVAGRERPAPEVVPARVPAAAAPAGAELDLARLERREAAAPQADPFAPRSFAPPPPAQPARAPAASPPAPEPTAPPLPFAYVGKITAEGRTEVLVTRGEDLIEIAPGRRIDEHYRVDAIDASSIQFTYLPLKTRQSLELTEPGG